MTKEDRKVMIVCLWGLALVAVGLALAGLAFAATLRRL
jgi:hypothetical protein